MPRPLSARACVLKPDITTLCAWPASLPANQAGALPVALAAPPCTWLFAAFSVPAPLYKAPTTTGRSISPCRNCTSTSCPSRGTKWPPQSDPATGSATRTQVPSASLAGALSAPAG
ncbi:hypothetical protein G6F57_021081 [Rhizopus arrhizus]|nr:hypothetical protein G6F57_021081 [Rhizopus arrhizus]